MVDRTRPVRARTTTPLPRANDRVVRGRQRLRRGGCEQLRPFADRAMGRQELVASASCGGDWSPREQRLVRLEADVHRGGNRDIVRGEQQLHLDRGSALGRTEVVHARTVCSTSVGGLHLEPGLVPVGVLLPGDRRLPGRERLLVLRGSLHADPASRALGRRGLASRARPESRQGVPGA